MLVFPKAISNGKYPILENGHHQAKTNGINELVPEPIDISNKQEEMYNSEGKLVNESKASGVDVINSDSKNVPKFVTNLKPVFLNEHQRKFANPISYLGGPRLPSRNRWSVESVVSLD